MDATYRPNLPVITVENKTTTTTIDPPQKFSKTSKHIRFDDETNNRTPRKKLKLKNLKPETPLNKMSDNSTGSDENSGNGDEWTSSVREEDLHHSVSPNQKKWKNLYRKHKVAILEMVEGGGGGEGKRNDGGNKLGATLGMDPQHSISGKLESLYLTKPEADVQPRVLDDATLSRSSDTNIRSAIPYLPKSAAVVCLVVNIFLPGVGTIMSGMMVFFCGEVRMASKTGARASTFCINLVVGWMQMMTVPFLLVGWMWSLVWGIYFILLSDEKLENVRKKEENSVKAKILSAFDPSFRAWTTN